MNSLNVKGLLAALLLTSQASVAEVAVIVHPSNTNALDNNTIARIFTGKMKSYADGSSAVPINQEPSSAATGEFNSKVLKKSASQLKAYWSKLVFTGKGTPPKAVGGDAEVIKLIAANPNLIGYVDASAVDGSVKVIGKF